MLLAALLLSLPAKVSGCSDGDTCTLDWTASHRVEEHNGTRVTTTIEQVAQKVRLCDVNTPERKGATLEAANKSRDVLLGWLKQAKVVEWRPALKDGKELHDSFGRWLGWIYADGVELNARLLSEGLAVPFREKCPR